MLPLLFFPRHIIWRWAGSDESGWFRDHRSLWTNYRLCQMLLQWMYQRAHCTLVQRPPGITKTTAPPECALRGLPGQIRQSPNAQVSSLLHGGRLHHGSVWESIFNQAVIRFQMDCNVCRSWKEICDQVGWLTVRMWITWLLQWVPVCKQLKRISGCYITLMKTYNYLDCCCYNCRHSFVAKTTSTPALGCMMWNLITNWSVTSRMNWWALNQK